MVQKRTEQTTPGGSRPVRRGIVIVAISLALTGCIDGLFPSSAATPTDTAKDVPTGFELVVFEAENCTTCLLFRRDIAPRYMQSIRGGTAPLRYVDVAASDPAAQAQRTEILVRPLRMIPTVIITEDGREFARIEGYTGPDNFFQMVAHAFKTRSGGADRSARSLPLSIAR